MRRQPPPAATPPAPLDVDDLVARCREHVADGVVGEDLPPDARRLAVAATVDRWMTDMGVLHAEDLLRQVVDDLVGFGPLEPLLADDRVTEIMVNGPERVCVEIDGRLQHRPDVRFRDAAHLRGVIDRVVDAGGRRIDDGAPMVDARLPDGSRVNAVVPPVAVDGPHLTIRRPPRRRLDFAALVHDGAVAGPVAAFLHAAVLGRCNILVVGASGAGKSTLLAAMCDLVPDRQRLVVLEDVAELVIHHPGAARQECRPAAPGGGREVTLRDLVRNALRMRPDRIVVGEVRGSEAVDMVTAMNTGHDGSMATMHANTPEDAVLRLESLLALGWSAPPAALRSWVEAAVDVVVQCERRADGGRRVTRVCALDPVSDPLSPMTPVFSETAAGRIDGCGAVPRRCLEKMARHGAMFPPALFAQARAA